MIIDGVVEYCGHYCKGVEIVFGAQDPMVSVAMFDGGFENCRSCFKVMDMVVAALYLVASSANI